MSHTKRPHYYKGTRGSSKQRTKMHSAQLAITSLQKQNAKWEELNTILMNALEKIVSHTDDVEIVGIANLACSEYEKILKRKT